MRRRFLLILALLAAVFAVMTGVAVRTGVLSRHPVSDQSVAIGGPFQLVDQGGHTVDQDVLKGKWSVVFFGYTFCPDACPTTMFALGQTQKLLGPAAARFQTVFISVDPARDTPKQVASFLSTDAFPKGAIGLTGSPDQVAGVAKAYHVYFQKAGPANGAAYAVDHSTMTYLMNPKGRFACVIPYDAAPKDIAAKLNQAMAGSDSAESC